jgi:low affinity Fe/Cu permease
MKMKNKNVVLYVLIVLLLMVSLFQAIQINELNNDMEAVVEIQDIQQELNESISVILDENIKSIITITDILVKIVN